MSKSIRTALVGLIAASTLALTGGVANASPSDAHVKGYNFHNLTKHEALESFLRKVVKKKHAPQYHEIANALAATLSPCEYEDSRNCVWLAQEMGNGIGHSFVNVRGVLYFFAPRDGLSPR